MIKVPELKDKEASGQGERGTVRLSPQDMHEFALQYTELSLLSHMLEKILPIKRYISMNSD